MVAGEAGGVDSRRLPPAAGVEPQEVRPAGMTERPAEGRAGKMRLRVECQVGRRPAGRVPGGARGIGTVGFRYAASRLLNRLRRERCDYSTGWVGELRLLKRLGGRAGTVSARLDYSGESRFTGRDVSRETPRGIRDYPQPL